MTILRAADKSLRALAVTLPSMQTPEVFAQCRASLTEGLRSLGLPHTSLVSIATFHFLFFFYLSHYVFIPCQIITIFMLTILLYVPACVPACVRVKECVAQCACRLTEGRLTPTAPPEETMEALTQVLELLHTARHPHLHRDAREGSYTPARWVSVHRSDAPNIFRLWGG